jgi:putative sugar O-methyltransferase
MQKFKISMLILFLPCVIKTDFNTLWYDMQSNLKELFADEQQTNATNLIHQRWHEKRQHIIKVLQGKPKPNFLREPCIAVNMVVGQVSSADLNFVKNKTKPTTRAALEAYNETNFGGLSSTCRSMNCAPDSLRQMYFMARILDNSTTPSINRIVELGGGYGSLARIAKSVLPDVTYIIIDLPEILALQNLFLKGSLPEASIEIHRSLPETFKKGSIHLIPHYLLPELDIKSVDVFVSIVALSETSQEMQNTVISKSFYNAKMCYVMGQKRHQYFLAPTHIIQNIKDNYPNAILSDYTHTYGGLYEIMGQHA